MFDFIPPSLSCLNMNFKNGSLSHNTKFFSLQTVRAASNHLRLLNVVVYSGPQNKAQSHRTCYWVGTIDHVEIHTFLYMIESEMFRSVEKQTSVERIDMAKKISKSKWPWAWLIEPTAVIKVLKRRPQTGRRWDDPYYMDGWLGPATLEIFKGGPKIILSCSMRCTLAVFPFLLNLPTVHIHTLFSNEKGTSFLNFFVYFWVLPCY